MIIASRAVLAACLMGASASATVFFKENFDDKWESRWVVPSKWKTAEELGAWNHTAGDWYGDAKDKGIKVRAECCVLHALLCVHSSHWRVVGDAPLRSKRAGRRAISSLYLQAV
jgi:hypothetical protein